MSSLKKNPKTQQIKSKFGLKQEKEKSEYTEKYCDVDAFYRFKDIAQSLRVTGLRAHWKSWRSNSPNYSNGLAATHS